MATSGDLIRVEHVIKEFNHGAVKALNDCSLTIQKGEVVAICLLYTSPSPRD